MLYLRSLVMDFKYINVDMSIPNSLTIPSHSFPLVTISMFSKSVSLFPVYPWLLRIDCWEIDSTWAMALVESAS